MDNLGYTNTFTDSILRTTFTYLSINCIILLFDIQIDGCETLLRNPEYIEAVQIYVDQWYSLCEDNFTQQTADIICRENHDSNASRYTFLPIQPSNHPIYPFYFQCEGNEDSICACEMIPHACSSPLIVYVECRKPGVFKS